MSQTVLLVDDSRPIHSVVKAWLATEPFRLLSAYGGKEALAAVAQFVPDLVLLDVEMPETDGFEVCRRLKADPATSNIPVVFLTGIASTEQKIRGLELGAVDYITKPFDPAELKARVRATLRTKYLMDLLAERALIDGLTGLWNRACFEKRLESELSMARRRGRPLSCVMIDVDHFKTINDTYGHPVGDEVLRFLGGLLTAACRTEDIVCRYGGEEFGILLPDASADQALIQADRLRLAILDHDAVHHSAPVKIACSFGVAEAHPTDDGPTLIAFADAALYKAKASGRNRVVRSNRPAAA